jgi:hypothetical protein|tara:strand:+ start:115 stop:699 length:585 start_codon:yes stop_codon:yes gene_type:complete
MGDTIQLKDNILKNKDIFLEKNKLYGILTKELVDYLGEDLFTAPASTMKSLHNAFPGGLIDHILKTTKYAIGINKLLPQSYEVDAHSIVKVCFLHQIGKTFLYKWNESEWHRNNQGKMYEFNEELVSLKIGERSAYYSLKYGTQLTDEEYQAIINYDKSDDDKQSKWYGCTLSTILKQANELAIIEEKTNQNDG